MPAAESNHPDADSLRLTPRDEDLLRGLTGRFRLITPVLVSRLWETSAASAGRRLMRLCSARLLLRTRVLVHPILDLQSPVVTWSPGQPQPDFGAVSYALKARWTSSACPSTVYFAALRTVHLFGGAGGTLDYPLQATHDLHVAAIYIRLRQDDPELAARWQGEELLREGRKKGRGKVCDAALVSVLPSGKVKLTRAVEFGGSYRADRVRAFHRVMENRRLPYELW
jgi:hypothetical protein